MSDRPILTRAEVEWWRSVLDGRTRSYSEPMTEDKALNLIDRLLEYAGHRDTCDWFAHPRGSRPCNCGYADLMRELEG